MPSYKASILNLTLFVFILGSGHFATVCIGTCRQCDGKQIPVSVKAIKHEIDTPNDEAQDEGNWPLKCYPPECIYYWTFDSTSDVWSYGVTMWEATSYGEKPYKGKRDQEILKFLIEDGKRMEKPPLCDEDVYDVMLGCWEYEKELRLKFAEIVSVMGSIHKRMINRETGT
ncbi:tyrosine-protein kinase ZAP-70-like [Dreissena polymorpha]|uniref:tyrosine-protein kinase ZAP-70-like n=1 Tax=Dreissena polymorpha TaxID=45954 RepID=UPI002263D6AC|nr:tyrosine-protein kinase ZAP-70-like [Dreissena polymorpha]